MNDIFSKLNSLKSIEPSESWVVDNKKRVLSEAPVFERKGVLGSIIDKKANLLFNIQSLFQNLTFKRLAVPAFSLIFVLSAGIFTVGASKSSLPGEPLYLLKMINEDMALVIASEDKKATIEMEHAGKRLEEMAVISKKTSDVEQQKKIGQLMERFEEKVKSANDNLTKTSKSVEKAKIAKAINTQSEKYTEVLAKTVEDLPAVIQDEILEEVAKAIDSNERIYLTSFAVIAEEEEEVIDEVGEEDQEDSVEDDEENTDIEDTEDDNSDDGDVLGDEDENNEPDLTDVIDDENADKSEDEEEIVSDEMEEEVIKTEIDEEVN